MMKKLVYVLVALVILSLAAGCGGPQETETPELQETVTPELQETETPELQETEIPELGAYWPTEGWRTSTPEEQDMDSAQLEQVTEYIEENGLADIGENGMTIDSVVVVRNGYIVFEEYPGGRYSKSMIHIIHSTTKSVISALIGIAIEEGYIDGIDQKMVDLFPERSIANLDSRKESITLEHMLTMTAGMEWDEWRYAYSDPQNHYIQSINSSDPVQYILDLPMATDPGEVWNYNGGTSDLLSALITKITGQDTLLFAREFLFDPLGVPVLAWNRINQGIRMGGGGLYLTPRDMAKFGYLYLHNGTWDGKQVVPADFVAESVKTQSFFSESSGYGYQSWWTLPQQGVYYAAGSDGQRIYVVPALDMVVVFTSYIPDNPERWLRHILYEFIMASCN